MAKPPAPLFNQINIVSRNPEASLAFYRRLGVHLPAESAWGTATGLHHVNGSCAADETLGLDVDSVAFAKCWNTGWRNREDLAGRVVLGFHFPTREAADACFTDLTVAGYTGLQPPIDAFLGARYATVADPDGTAVGLMSPISDAMRSPPPNV